MNPPEHFEVSQREHAPRVGLVWIALLVPPFLFLALLGLLWALLGLKSHHGGQDVGRGFELVLPYVLIANHTLLFAGLLRFLRREGMNLKGIGWRFQSVRTVTLEIVGGLILGTGLRYVDRFVLLNLAQRMSALLSLPEPSPSGDLVYSGATFAAWLLFLTLFAGVVEESLYRGYAITKLSERFQPIWAVLISSVFFGLPHFAEGVSGILDAAMFGALLGGVYLCRCSLVPLAVAHATANVLDQLGH